jgi:pSer/pThr/pTyr-binding forkhead associated (FHA) protein
MVMKLYVLSGPQKEREFAIDKDVIVGGRSDKENKWHPDIDFEPDKKVSRKHCKIWQEQGNYWIKDLQSKHGTLVNGQEIKERENGTLLEKGSEVRIGDSVLRFESENCVHIEQGGLRINFELLENVNFSLLHCGFPLISNFEIHNKSNSDFQPQEISFLLCGYSKEKNIKLPFLKSGESISVGDINIELDSLRFEGQIETANTELLVKIKGETALRKNISVLAYNEFSLEEQPEDQVSLACFVQPQHPVVQNVVKGIDTQGGIPQVTKVIYDCLSTQYHLRYEAELSYSPKRKIQKVRLSHQILGSTDSNKGSGTCIDLSVLFVSCLENAGLKPLFFLIKDKTNCAHAFAGCWQQDNIENIKPLFLDKEELLNMVNSGKLLLVECTGFTQGKEHLSFDLAVAKASEILKNHDLLYVLDIYAARRYGGREGISPLPFVGTPHYSEEIGQVFNKARDFALACRSKVLGTPHLLLGLLDLKDGIMQKIFLEQGIDPQLASRRIMKGLQDNALVDSEPKPTYHYEEVINIAGIIARRQDSAFVKEPHLIEALLEVRSDALEKALRILSASPQQCLHILYQITSLKSSFINSKSFFCDK